MIQSSRTFRVFVSSTFSDLKAIATAHGMDFLLTWNCRHIANPVIQARIAAHLESIGLLLPFICTPEELLGEENE